MKKLGFTLLAILFCFSLITLIPANAADTILFSDGFESGNFTTGGWVCNPADGPNVITSQKYEGTRSAQVEDGDRITKSLSTVGKTGITLKYARRIDSNNGGHFYAEWYNGSSWIVLENITTTCAWTYKTWTLPSGANNNANFKFRFRTTSGLIPCYIDSILVSSGSGSTPTPTPTATPTPTPPPGSVTVYPGDNLQQKADTYSNGTYFVLSAGTYYNQSVTPKTGQTFDGQGVAILDGGNTTQKAFQGTGSNVSIKNLTIQNYASLLQQAAVDSEFGNAWLIQNNIIRNNLHIGVNWGNNTSVIGNQLLNNGMAGFSGGGSGWILEDNDIFDNNTQHLEWGFEAGGGKITVASNGTVRGNRSAGNDGPGIWLDVDANGITVENNVCWDNEGPGIMVEISESVIVRNNTSAYNGYSCTDWSGAQILISSSTNCDVYGNIVDINSGVNERGIFIMSQDEREYSGINNEVYNNTITLRGTQLGINGVDCDDGAPVYTTNNFHNNTYHLQSLSTAFFSWEDDSTFAQVQTLGRESGSIANTSLPAIVNYDALYR